MYFPQKYFSNKHFFRKSYFLSFYRPPKALIFSQKLRQTPYFLRICTFEVPKAWSNRILATLCMVSCNHYTVMIHAMSHYGKCVTFYIVTIHVTHHCEKISNIWLCKTFCTVTILLRLTLNLHVFNFNIVVPIKEHPRILQFRV